MITITQQFSHEQRVISRCAGCYKRRNTTRVAALVTDPERPDWSLRQDRRYCNDCLARLAVPA